MFEIEPPSAKQREYYDSLYRQLTFVALYDTEKALILHTAYGYSLILDLFKVLGEIRSIALNTINVKGKPNIITFKAQLIKQTGVNERTIELSLSLHENNTVLPIFSYRVSMFKTRVHSDASVSDKSLPDITETRFRLDYTSNLNGLNLLHLIPDVTDKVWNYLDLLNNSSSYDTCLPENTNDTA